MGEEKSVEQQADDFIRDSPFPLTEVDKWILSQTDEEWHFHDWEDLKGIIGEYLLLLFFPWFLSFFLLPVSSALSILKVPYSIFRLHADISEQTTNLRPSNASPRISAVT